MPRTAAKTKRADPQERPNTLPAKPRKGIGVIVGDTNAGRPEWEQDGTVRVISPYGTQGQPSFSGYDSWVEGFKANPFVSAGVQLVAGTTLASPPRVVKSKNTASHNPERQKILETFLEDPHEYYTADEFFESEMETAILAGRVYIEVAFNELNQPAKLWDLPQNTIFPRPNEKGGFAPNEAFWQVIRDKRQRVQEIYKFPFRNILWWRMGGMRSNSVNPYSPMELLTVPNRSTTEAQDYIHSFFSTGGKMGLVIMNADWDLPQAKEMLRYYQKEYAKTKQGHKMLVLYGGTTVSPPPKEHNSWAEFINIQSFDGRKVAGVLGYDPRLVGYPGEGNLGGKGEREELLVELHERCNPKRKRISKIFTKQIVQDGFGFYDWEIEWPLFTSQADAQSKQMLSDTYEKMQRSALLNVRDVKDINVARQSIDTSFREVLEVDMETWPEPVAPGQPVPESALDGSGAPAPVEPAVPPEPQKRRAPKGAAEKRTPWAEINAHIDDFEEKTKKALVGPVLEALAKSRVKLADAFVDKNPMAAMRKLTLISGGSQVQADFVRALKDYYKASVEVCRDELKTHAKTLKAAAKSEKRKISEMGPGNVNDFIEGFGRRQLDDLYNDLTSREQDMFEQGLRAGWSQPEMLAHLVEVTDDFAEAVINTIIRTSGTDFFSQARIKAGQESDIVAFYRFSAITDDRTTDVCETLDGIEIAPHDPKLHVITPPCHYNCRSMWTYGLEGEDFQTDTEQLARGIKLIPAQFGGPTKESRGELLARAIAHKVARIVTA